MKRVFCILFLAALGTANAFGQAPAAAKASEKPKVRPPWELEWAYLSKYRDADAQLEAPRANENRVVFMGDSITEGWAGTDPRFFDATHYVDRGISGQTTSQMLVRFRQDVIGLKPAVVVILGGTNDIAENGGITTLGAIEDNLQSMVELAQVNRIRVVLASVLPTRDYPWRRGLNPAPKIAALNRWMLEFCRQHHLVYLDYYSALATSDGAMKPGLSIDGVHPSLAGYSIMEPLAEAAVRDALKP